MADNTELPGAQGTQQNDKPEQPPTTQDPPQELTNADLKNHPWVIGLKEELNTLRRAEAERQAATEKATREAEIKDAEAKSEFEKAAKLREAETERMKSDYESQLLTERLTNKLLGANFSERGIALMLTEHDPEKHADLDAYVKACAENEANAVFLKTADPADPKKPAAPGTPPVAGPTGAPNWEQVKAWEKGDDLEKRKEARKINRAYYDTHGKFPYEKDW